MSNHVAKSDICLERRSIISQFHFIENVSKTTSLRATKCVPNKQKTSSFPCKKSSYTRISEEVVKWFFGLN